LQPPEQKPMSNLLGSTSPHFWKSTQSSCLLQMLLVFWIVSSVWTNDSFWGPKISKRGSGSSPENFIVM
jgi:hypothetical protein